MDGPPFYPDDYLTVREAAHQFNVSPGSIDLRIKNNELTVRKRGRMYFLLKRRSSLLTLLSKNDQQDQLSVAENVPRARV